MVVNNNQYKRLFVHMGNFTSTGEGQNFKSAQNGVSWSKSAPKYNPRVLEQNIQLLKSYNQLKIRKFWFFSENINFYDFLTQKRETFVWHIKWEKVCKLWVELGRIFTNWWNKFLSLIAEKQFFTLCWRRTRQNLFFVVKLKKYI